MATPKQLGGATILNEEMHLIAPKQYYIFSSTDNTWHTRGTVSWHFELTKTQKQKKKKIEKLILRKNVKDALKHSIIRKFLAQGSRRVSNKYVHICDHLHIISKDANPLKSFNVGNYEEGVELRY